MTAQTHSTAATLNFDDPSFSGLLNNETFTVNGGGTLVINSDPQWAQNAAYLGNVTATNGTVRVDGTTVRWLRISSPTGTTPAVGTVITGGSSGSNGEVIGTWTTFPGNPVAAGSAVGAELWLKLRSVSGGSFQNGETVTGGNLSGGTANGSDTVGWLLIVQNDNNNTNGGAQFTAGSLGNIEIEGSWYTLGNGNGAANQTITHYTPDLVPFVEVETASGSNIWTQYWNRVNIIKEYVSENEPCFIQAQGSATLTFDRRVIPNGASVRVPNIHFAATNSTAWATQTRVYSNNNSGGGPTIAAGAAQGGRPGITSGGINVSMRKCIGAAWRVNLANWYGVTIEDCGFFARNWMTNIYGNVNVNGMVCVPYDGTVALSVGWDCSNLSVSNTINRMLAISASGNNTAGSNVTEAQLYDTGSSALNQPTTTVGGSSISYMKNATFTNCRFLRYIGRLLGAGNGPATINDNINISFNNCEFQGGAVSILRNTNISFTGTTWDKFMNGSVFTMFGFTGGTGTPAIGETVTGVTSGATGIVLRHPGGTSGNFGLVITSGNFGATENLTFSGGGTATRSAYNIQSQQALFFGSGNSRVRVTGFGWANTSPYGADAATLINFIQPSIEYARIRNIGSIASPLDLLSKTSFVNIGVPSSDIKVQRCYITNLAGTAPEIISTETGASNIVIDNVSNENNQVMRITPDASRVTIRGGRMNNDNRVTGSGGGVSNTYNFSIGNIYVDYFISSTAGGITFKPTSIDSTTSQYVTVSGAVRYNRDASWNFSSTNDTLTIEMPEAVYGHTGLTDINNNLSSGGFTYDYQIALGNEGNWSEWKTANSTNLLAESVSPTVGFKLKLRVTNPSNDIRSFNGSTFQTTTTLADQRAALYPLANPPVTYTNCISGSVLTSWNVISKTYFDFGTSNSNSVTTNPPWNSDFNCLLRLRKAGYRSSEQTVTVVEDGNTLIASQIQIATISGSDPGVLGIEVTNHGASPVTWNSKQYSITIRTTDDNLTADQIANFINFNISKSGDWNGFKAHAWHEMIEPDGSSFKTVRGELLGSAGATLKGVRVVRSDSNTAVSGFTTFMADDGTTYSVPTLNTGTVSGFTSGSRVIVYNVTQDSEIYNAIISGGTSLTLNYVEGTDFSVGDTVDIFHVYYQADGTYATTKTKSRVSATSAGWASTITEQEDIVYTSYYQTFGTKGHLVYADNEFSYDGLALHVDISDLDGTWYAHRLYQWDIYALWFTGNRQFFQKISSNDPGTINISNIYLDNVNSYNYVQGDTIRIKRDDLAYPVILPTAGGGGIDVIWQQPVLQTTTGGISPSETQIKSWIRGELGVEMSRIDANISSRADQTIVNNIKKKTNLIPASL